MPQILEKAVTERQAVHEALNRVLAQAIQAKQVSANHPSWRALCKLLSSAVDALPVNDESHTCDGIAIARVLLKVRQAQRAWADKIRQAGLEFEIPGEDDIGDLVLDLLGVPKDYTVSVPHGDEGFCRDWHHFLCEKMVFEKGDVDAYIDVMTGKRQLDE